MLPDRYVPRKTTEITKTDRKVSILGKVVQSTADSFTLEDDNGTIEIFFGENFEGGSPARVKIEKNKIVRAFCTVVGEQLRLDVVQDLTGLDLNLLKTVDELYSKAGV